MRMTFIGCCAARHDADDVHRLLRGEALQKPTVADLLAEHAAPVKARPATPPEADTGEIGPGVLPQPG